MTKLEPTEAQRELIIEEVWAVCRANPRSAAEEAVDRAFAAANSIPEGPPVGTIARRPDGNWLAHRGTEQDWTYFPLVIAQEWPRQDSADSWPVIYDPTKPEPRREYALCVPHPSGPVPHYDTICEHPSRLEGRPKDQPDEAVHSRLVYGWELVDPTAQQEPESALAPEPRVLPSLDCEEARDGAVWANRYGVKVQYRQHDWWYTDYTGGPTLPMTLTNYGPYTEVLGDPS